MNTAYYIISFLLFWLGLLLVISTTVKFFAIQAKASTKNATKAKRIKKS
jgi:hypothetical protein